MGLPIKLEFLYYKIDLPQNEDGSPSTVADLIKFIVDTMIKDPKDVEVFLENGTIRPGILTLINDTDWELEGEEGYELEAGDVIAFTSTLHGG
ncbi:hypothetical protein BN7_2334 [Wickerhamomyces ciferrii]|uniref:Ubiquitin-related modifier 1 n=1 Tax=Wickerhamomyces ciferrii (strain ATCC 14091 / BCRC 22168 / CBS 111 / JCM 3599 / NBRC 0793 / NRRL Y-1031 F-60-10) TaxID=1206466 RepID=K0KCK4_WICCF|nr:uncharacterized protein BN7_2334 [Wickerhamomyces ciferrii]CCH42790.1 hypothetical protein BN7_2334 [Wickerhamomyces ciferrii]